MQEKERFSENSVRDAAVFIGLLILIGSTIGLIFHHYPFPVNGSVFIQNEKVK